MQPAPAAAASAERRPSKAGVSLAPTFNKKRPSVTTQALVREGMSDKELREQLRPIFDRFDVDGSGAVSTDEMGRLVTALKMPMTDEELARLMVDADPDGSGEIDFEEFVAALKSQLGGGGGGLASVFMNVSSSLGWMNPISWFSSSSKQEPGAQVPAEQQPQTQTPVAERRSLAVDRRSSAVDRRSSSVDERRSSAGSVSEGEAATPVRASTASLASSATPARSATPPRTGTMRKAAAAGSASTETATETAPWPTSTLFTSLTPGLSLGAQRGMPQPAQPQSPPTRVLAVGYSQWKVYDSNRSSGDEVRQQSMDRKSWSESRDRAFLRQQKQLMIDRAAHTKSAIASCVGEKHSVRQPWPVKTAPLTAHLSTAICLPRPCRPSPVICLPRPLPPACCELRAGPRIHPHSRARSLRLCATPSPA